MAGRQIFSRNDQYRNMFVIEKKQMGNTVAYRVVNLATKEWIEVLPAWGGRINQVALQKNHKIHTLLECCISEREYCEEGIPWYRGAHLFPYPDRVNKGHYVFGDTAYQLPKNKNALPHALHGFVDDKEFNVVQKESHGAYGKIICKYVYEGALTGYPFSFELLIEHSLSPEGYSCVTKVVNTGKGTMPLGDGWHPYIRTGCPAVDLKLQITSDTYYTLDESLIPRGNTAYNPGFLKLMRIGQPGFHVCFGHGGQDQRLRSCIRDEQANLDVVVWQQGGPGGYRFTQFYIPPSGRSLAVEPLTCIPDSFNNGIGLLHLGPGKTQTFYWGIQLKQR